MRTILKRAGLALLLAMAIYAGVGGVMTATAANPAVRGQLIDVGGRRMHIVCAGPDDAPAPLIVMESGAFGLSADWGAVQEKLAEKGLRSCAYDRAGLGVSDPGPVPRDSLSITRDLETLLTKARLPGPYILVGHSMAGLHVRLFTAQHRDQVAGVVLVDAATPETSQEPRVAGFVKQFANLSRLAATGARLGLFKPLEGTGMADAIGLTGQAAVEKRRAFASASHNKWSAQEVLLWQTDASQAIEAGGFDPAMPVAVVTAGPARGREGWKAAQAGPAKAAKDGYVENVEAASHASLLGPKHADAIVRGVMFVLEHRRP